MLNANPPVAHQSDSEDLQDDQQTPSEWKGISTLKLAAGQQGKLMKTQFWHLWRSNIYQLLLFLFIAWRGFTMW